MNGTADKNTGFAAWTASLCVLLCATACSSADPDVEGSATAGSRADPPDTVSAVSPVDRWGVEVVALRLTLRNTMLDLRYRVLDAEKARPLFDGKIKPYLLDPSSGAALGMPEDTKLGALRSSPRNPPVAGKQYFILFSNGQGTVKRGDKVTVLIGDFRLDDVVVD